MASALWSIVFFIIAIGILVAVHEWGHFWVARRLGVKVLQFNIGFGKPLWSRVDSKGTKYVIAAIPLGGYVRMLDERIDVVKPEDRHCTFNSKTVPQRMAVFAAGPLVNLIFAACVMYVVFLLGVATVKPIVGSVTENSVAAQAGLPAGVKIVAVGGRQTRDWEAVNFELIAHIGDPSVTIGVEDPNTLARRTHMLRVADWEFDPSKTSTLQFLGILPYRPPTTTEIAWIADNSPAERAGLQINDKIVELAGTSSLNWSQIVGVIAQRPGVAVDLVVERAGERVPLAVTVGEHPHRAAAGYLGIVPKSHPWPEQYRYLHQYGVFGSLLEATAYTWRLIALSVEMVGKFITGDVSVKNLSGPIAIAQGAGTSAEYGLEYFLKFMALISVNLGIINLLPLPVLDGGHLLYHCIELLRGKPVSEQAQAIGFRIGAALLLTLMSIAIINDILRL